LEKSYGSLKALDGISFDVKEDEVFGFLGPNGAGKTTTIEILIGLRDRDAGEIEVLGHDPAREPEQVKGRIGVQLQTSELYPRLTVKEVLDLFSSFYSSTRPVEEILLQVGLQSKRGSQVRQLSGGQKQRLALALAIINRGSIIFMDEPTTGLDPQSRRQLWDVISSLQKEGSAIFLTTHYMEEAERLCDRVAIIDHGRIIALGSPAELIKENFQEQALEFRMPAALRDGELGNLPGVVRVQGDEDNMVTLYSNEVAATMSGLLGYAEQAGAELNDVVVRRATLEDVFLKLTGRRIRE